MNKYELKCNRYPGFIWIDDSTKRRTWTQDQLIPKTEDTKYVALCNAANYFYRTYGITLNEYYNIIVHEDINYIPKCQLEGCNNIPEFRSLVLGYLSTCCKAHANIMNARTENHRSKASQIMREYNLQSWKILSTEKQN